MKSKLWALGALILQSAFLQSCADDIPQSGVTIYTADKIITVDDQNSIASAVAVKDGVIIDLGDLANLKAAYKDASVDNALQGKVIIPGLIDPHVHMTLGAMMYGLPFAPPWDMPVKDGWVKGSPDQAAFLERVRKIESEASDGPLVIYGYHNLIQGDLTRADLDAVTTDRPLFIWHYSGHDFYLNSAAIEFAGLTPALADKFHGVDLDANGALTGRIYEDAGLALFPALAPILMSEDNIARGFQTYESLFKKAGITTVAELGYGIFTRAVEDNNIAKYYDKTDAYRLFLVPEHRAFSQEFKQHSAAKILEMSQDSSSRARVLPQVKLFTDAAFYSQTMRLKDPGYTGGQSEGTMGLWVTEEDPLTNIMKSYWDAGLDIRIHSNGNAAQEATLNAFSKMPAGTTNSQRLVIEHAGLIEPEQLARMSQLGIGLSAASHYVYYMGEDYESAIGDRVRHITPLRSAADMDMRVTLHSDAPLAPPTPLLAASVHMTRATRQGGVSTPSERLTAEQALRAVTLDAAWALGLDDKIGSIEPGKFADFTILDKNPLTTPPEEWANIGVVGVMVEQTYYPVE